MYRRAADIGGGVVGDARAWAVHGRGDRRDQDVQGLQALPPDSVGTAGSYGPM